MPEPFERGNVIAGLKVVARVDHAHYRCVCYRCKRYTIVAARSLQRKRGVDCPHCFTPRKYPKPAPVRDRKGWLSVLAEVA